MESPRENRGLLFCSEYSVASVVNESFSDNEKLNQVVSLPVIELKIVARAAMDLRRLYAAWVCFFEWHYSGGMLFVRGEISFSRNFVIVFTSFSSKLSMCIGLPCQFVIDEQSL